MSALEASELRGGRQAESSAQHTRSQSTARPLSSSLSPRPLSPQPKRRGQQEEEAKEQAKAQPAAAVFAHSFAAQRLRRPQSVSIEPAASQRIAADAEVKTAQTAADAADKPASAGGSGRRVVHRAGGSSIAAATPLSARPASPSQPPTAAPLLQPSSASSQARPGTAPSGHRRSNSMALSVPAQASQPQSPRSPHTPLSPPSPLSPSGRKQRKPKPGPLLNAAPSSRLYLDLSDSPGVGSYRSYSSFSSDGKKGVRMHERIVLKDSKAELPAPGQYDGAHASTLQQAGAGAMVSMGGQAARTELFTAVGEGADVGSYSLPSSIGTGPAARVRSRSEVKDDTGVPGVGQYDAYGSTLASRATGMGLGKKETGMLDGVAAGPAPGDYALPSTLGSAPAASIRSRIELKDPKAALPGPGAYSEAASSLLSASGALSMDAQSGRSELFPLASATAATGLGPGAYDSELHAIGRDAPAASMHARTVDPLEASSSLRDGPGPAHYDTEIADSNRTAAAGAAVSMGGQAARGQLFALQGEGADAGLYELPSSIGSGPAASIRHKLELQDGKAALPAPGQYSGAYASSLCQAGSGLVSMAGQAQRQELFTRQGEGADVGAYDIKSTLGSAPAASIRSRLELADPKAALPAPGQYSGAHASSLGSSGGAQLSMAGQQGRGELWPELGQGADVGSYDIASSIGTGPAASIRHKLELGDGKAATPAPGQYSGAYASSMQLAGRGLVSMAGQAQRQELFTRQGEGADVGLYDIASSIGSGPAAAIRHKLEVADPRAALPAPGQYSGAYSSTLQQAGSGAVSMAQQASRSQLFALQGEGADAGLYELPSSIGSGPAASIRHKLELQDGKAALPAPGQYSGAYASSLCQAGSGLVSMAGQAQRQELFTRQGEGADVGAYDIKSTLGSAPAASIRSRLELADPKAALPAPGQYSGAHASSLGSSGGAQLSMAGQQGRGELWPELGQGADVGSYDIASSIGTGPAASIRHKLELGDGKAATPAPGQYSGAYASSMQLAGRGLVSMAGQAQRQELFTRQGEGADVGLYDIASSIGSGPAAAIRHKLEVADPRAALPAPGQYSGAYSSTLQQAGSGAVSMAQQASRSQLFALQGEGADAGLYELPSSIGSGPAASIRHKLELQDGKAALPAPGQYSGAYASSLCQAGSGLVSMAGQAQRQELFTRQGEGADVGAYDIKSTLGSAPAASIRSRLELADPKAALPAPGQYSGAHASSLGSSGGAQLSMAGQQGRGELWPELGQGADVGSYDIASSIGTGPAASIRHKLELGDGKAATPAPGQYSGAYASSMQLAGRGLVSMAGQAQRQELFTRQGEGADVGLYDIASSIGSGPAAAIRHKLEVADPRAALPAPGQYSGAYSSTLQQAGSGAVSMAQQASRSQLFALQGEGADAGLYELPSSIGSGPAASIRHKLELQDGKAALPAPGQYSGAYASSLCQAGSGLVSMAGQAQRQELFTRQGEGADVGAYDIKSTLGSAPAASIRSRLELADPKAALPAPGQYSSAHASSLGSSGGAQLSMAGQQGRGELWPELGQGADVGSYDIASSIGTGPAASIRHKLELGDGKAATPAPGQYSGAYASSMQLAGRGLVSMAGQAQRQELFTRQGEGADVGLYDIASSIGSGPAAAIRHKLEVADPRAALPAPGQYSGAYSSTLQQAGSGAVSMAQQASRSQLFALQGEGADAGLYELPSSIGSGPAASIRHKLELQDGKAALPAPGQYSGAYASSLCQAGSGLVSMAGQAQRQELFTRQGEGADVGAYDIKSTLGSAPAASIRSRLELADPKAALPAPGQYSGAHASSLGSSGGAQLSMAGQQGRGELWPELGQGADVGSYDIASSIGTGPAASIRHKLELGDGKAATPAPGQYSGAYASSMQLAGRGLVSMAGQAQRQELFTRQGEGADVGLYDIASSIGSGPAAAIRHKLEVADPRAALPAPGQYSGAYSSTLQQAGSGAVSMAQQASRSQLFALQGEGADAGLYELPSSIGSGPAASIRHRLELRDGSAYTPAPGQYDGAHGSTLSVAGRGSVVMEAQSSRPELFAVGAAVPGPGSYDSARLSIGNDGPHVSMHGRTVDPLEATSSLRLTPGPASYDTARDEQDGRRTLSMAAQSARGELFSAAGEGADAGLYELPSSIGSGPAARVRGRSEVKDGADVPGVGEYDGAYTSTLRSRAVSMGVGKKESGALDGQADGPAPGDYDIASSMGDAPAAAIRSRPELRDPKAELPAPGQYDVQYSNPALERDFTFGGIHRPSANLRQFMDDGAAEAASSGYNTSGQGLLD